MATDESNESNESKETKLIPHAVTFLAPEGFEPITYYQVAMTKDERFFVNAQFNNPPLVLLLQAQGVLLSNSKIAQYFKKPKEESRIWTPPGMMRGQA